MVINDLVKKLIDNGIHVEEVVVSEDVDRDMQQIGERRYLPGDFIEKYQEIRHHGQKLKYEIHGEFKDMDFELIAREGSKNFSLMSGENIEITDLLRINL